MIKWINPKMSSCSPFHYQTQSTLQLLDKPQQVKIKPDFIIHDGQSTLLSLSTQPTPSYQPLLALSNQPTLSYQPPLAHSTPLYQQPCQSMLFSSQQPFTHSLDLSSLQQSTLSSQPLFQSLVISSPMPLPSNLPGNQQAMPDWTNNELESLLSETSLNYRNDLPIPSTPPPPPPPPGNSAQLVSPERVMVQFPGWSLGSLCTLNEGASCPVCVW